MKKLIRLEIDGTQEIIELDFNSQETIEMLVSIIEKSKGMIKKIRYTASFKKHEGIEDTVKSFLNDVINRLKNRRNINNERCYRQPSFVILHLFSNILKFASRKKEYTEKSPMKIILEVVGLRGDFSKSFKRKRKIEFDEIQALRKHSTTRVSVIKKHTPYFAVDRF